MWLEKLSLGVLRVLTPLGPRYVNPSFVQRLYLLWIFRNFHTLPVKVLTPRQLKRIDSICARHGYVSLQRSELAEPAILGTLEQRPPLESELLPRRPNQSVTDAMRRFATDAQQRS
ncbi:MAG: hypothetical protein WB952_17465 [Terriglobales bacterium]